MITENLNAELVAMLLTDGSVSFSGENGREIIFRNRDEKLLNNFEDILKKLGITPQKRRFFRRAFQSKVGNKKLAEFLLDECNSFRTLSCNSQPICAKLRGKEERKPCKICIPFENDGKQFPTVNIPEFIKNNIELSRKFLQIVSSTEGCVKFSNKKWITRKITIGCSHPKLSEEIRDILSKFGIKTKIHGTEIIIESKENMKKFKEEIGFLDSVKVHRGKNWIDFEKNDVLNIMLNSFKQASSQT